MTKLGTSDRPLRVAVIGAGPSGFYTAAALLQQPGLEVRVDVFDRLPAPFGLVRYGVAPDHQKIKLVSRVFEKVAADPRVRFFGNVTFGSDLHHADFRRHYDQVVYAVGGQTDRKLTIPGEDLEGSYSSTAFVAWYSGHPDFIDLRFDLTARRVAVVGIGNVAMDVARILAKQVDELATTDIADPALEALRASRVEEIQVLARRGPVQAACTPPELKELGEIEGVDVVVDPQDLELDAASAAALEEDRQAQKTLDVLRELAERGAAGNPRRIVLRFLVSPVEILGERGHVSALRLERNRLEPTPGGYLQAVGTGRFETLPLGMVVKAVGYRSIPLPGVPFDERRGIIPNRAGRVVDPATGEPLPGEYAVGWVKRGPSGLIGSNKPDANETVEAMLADLPDTEPVPADDAAPEAVERLLEERGIRGVVYDEWRALDRLEIEAGKPHGRPRIKFCRVEEMLEALESAG